MSGEAALLAFDVSTPTGSVALARDGAVVARRFLLRPREHAARLVPAIGEVLEEAGVEREELDGIVVGRGPGSFTGVRIGAATARGLSHGLGVPLWPRSSLAGAAASAGVAVPPEVGEWNGGARIEARAATPNRPRYVLFDARGDRVYAACFRFPPGGGMETILEPSATTIPEVLASDLPEGVVFCGRGALVHHGALAAAGYALLPPPAGIPTAEGLLRVHALFADDPPEPEGSRWEPEYIRGSSATRPALSSDVAEA